MKTADGKTKLFMYKIPVEIQVAGKSPEHALSHVRNLIKGEGGLYDVWGYVSIGPVRIDSDFEDES